MFPFIKREEANTARKLPLYTSNGVEYSLDVISVHSDAFKVRKGAIMREAAQSASDGSFNDTTQRELTAKLAASTITGWVLPEEFGEYSKEGAEKLLIDYPQISDAVDTFSSEQANYLAKK